MSWLTDLGRLFVPEPVQTRSEFPGFDEQLAAIRNAQAQPRPWRLASVQEALGVPAILSAVSLISGVAGSLSMEAFRSGALVSDQTQIPRLLLRPNPRSTAREFNLKTAFYQATRGEFWWWVAHRDTDGNPDALFPVPPWEIVVEPNDRDRLNPTIRWLARVMPNADMRHQMYLPGPDGLRGVGPLQLAGAAVSVTVEASNWAANFFAGNLPSIIGTTDQDLDENDLKALDLQWQEKPGNLPRWASNGMSFEFPPIDADRAQLNDTRAFQVGEVARMFGIPGPLLEYQMSGSSLTYRNEEDIWSDFQRRCLSPQYLEPIEQEMSDLLPRTVVGRFNLDQLLRADIATRFETYKIGIESGIYGPEFAQRKEGIIPGNVDFAPVPFSPPAADPGAIPMRTRSLEPVRCSHCKALIGEASGAYRLVCRRCKTVNESLAEEPFMPAMLTALLAARSEPQQLPPISINPQIALAAPDLSVMENMVAEQKESNQIQARNSEMLEELLGRDVPTPQVHYTPPEVVVTVPKPDPVVIQFPRPTRKVIERDKNGRIVGLREEPA
jgi:HK97 family phage portal protein